MGIIRRVSLWITTVFALTLAFVLGFAAFAPTGTAAEKTDVIVVLGAGLSKDGTLHHASQQRVDRGVSLWQRGLAQRLHFTGGVARADGRSAGEIMAARAIAQGIPEDAISFEGRSQSTLQNAVFSQPMLESANSIRLVTEGFHLARSWVSFRWTSTRKDGPPAILLSHSERFRSATPDSPYGSVKMVLREVVAIWFNLARAVIHDVAGWLGVPDDTRAAWLA